MTNEYGDDDYDPLYDPDYEPSEPEEEPKLYKLQVMVDHNNEVFICWIDGKTSGTLTLTAEEAVELGRVGKMAGARRDGAKFLETIGEIEKTEE